MLHEGSGRGPQARRDGTRCRRLMRHDGARSAHAQVHALPVELALPTRLAHKGLLSTPVPHPTLPCPTLCASAVALASALPMDATSTPNMIMPPIMAMFAITCTGLRGSRERAQMKLIPGA